MEIRLLSIIESSGFSSSWDPSHVYNNVCIPLQTIYIAIYLLEFHIDYPSN